MYEYKTEIGVFTNFVRQKFTELQQIIKKYADKGWKLHSFEIGEDDGGHFYVCIFEREKKSK